MNDLPLPITIHDEIAEVRREIRYRSVVYPRLVSARKLTQGKASYQERVMKQVLARLCGIAGVPVE